MTTRTLDLGCGAYPQNPFHADELFGVDLHADPAQSVTIADLAVESIPHADETFDYVTAFDLVGFIPRVVYAPQRRHAFVEFMNEAWRVLRPGGYFMVSTPADTHLAAMSDPTFVNPIAADTLSRFFDDEACQARAYGFTGAFRMVRQEMRNGSQLFAVMRKVPALPDEAKKPDARISVFVPVYNGARFIERTLDALLAQTHADFEVLCIDDCSTDDSPEILHRYARRDARIRVLRTPSNLGLAAKAVNFGLPHMSGEYFVYASQDDLFSADWLEKMHARAVETGADAVVPDLVFHYPDNPARDTRLSGLRGNRNVELSGREAVLHSLDWSIPGNALWRARMVRFFGFEDFGLNADEYTSRVLFLNANKVVFSEGTFFYRQDNASAVTKKMTYKTFDYAYTQLRLYQMLAAENFPQEVLQQQAIKAVTLRNQLRQWLDEHGATSFTAAERQQALDRLVRVTDSMKRDPMFAQVA